MSSSQHSPSPPAQAAPSETDRSPSPSTQPASETVSSQSLSAASNQEIDPVSKARNAAAQARHRAKRKAYVAQLEQSVNTLKDTLKNATNQALVQQLEEENRRLTEELLYLQAQLEGSGSSDDGQGISNVAQWVGSTSGRNVGYMSQYLAPPGMSSYSGSASQFDEMDEFDEAMNSTEFGLKGWNPEQK